MNGSKRRELRRLWAALAKVIGPGRAPDAGEIRRRWQGWKDGRYDPTTGVWS